MYSELNYRKVAVGAGMLALFGTVILMESRPLRANDQEQNREAAQARRGLEISPVALKMSGKDPYLVGLGSYIVNAQSGCNDCHSAGPVTQFLPGGNPFFGQTPVRVNAATFMGGGRNFGPLVPNSPDIVSRNLTPDKTGRALGGDNFQKFLYTMRTGVDPDHVHPTCTASPTAPCLPPPFDGELLQIMPWNVMRQMTDHDLLAVYEYLGALPCVEGGPGEPAVRCH